MRVLCALLAVGAAQAFVSSPVLRRQAAVANTAPLPAVAEQARDASKAAQSTATSQSSPALETLRFLTEKVAVVAGLRLDQQQSHPESCTHALHAHRWLRMCVPVLEHQHMSMMQHL